MVQGSKKSRKGVSLEVEIDGKLETKEYDKVIVAVGRRPFTENLLAEGCGLETDEKGFIDVMNSVKPNSIMFMLLET